MTFIPEPNPPMNKRNKFNDSAQTSDYTTDCVRCRRSIRRGEPVVRLRRPVTGPAHPHCVEELK